MIKSIINSLKNDSKYTQYFDTNKKLSYVMISTGGYKSYEKGKIVFLILHDGIPSITVKFYKVPHGLIQDQFKKQEIIYNKCDGKGIPKPLGILMLNDNEIMIEEGVNGKNLERYISDNPSQDLVKSIIHKIISLYEHLNNSLEPSTFADLNKELDQNLDRFIELYSPSENELLTIRKCISIFLQNFKNEKISKRYTNGDFISRNLIVDDENVTLVDFEYVNKTHLYFFDWFRFFKYQYAISNDYLYNIVLNTEINDDLFLSSLKEFTKYRSNKKFDIASRLIFEIREYILRSDSSSVALGNEEKKGMSNLIANISSFLNGESIINTTESTSNDIISSKKEFYHNMYSKIHEYTESDNKIQNIQKKIIKQEKKIKELVNEKESLQRKNAALSSFVDHDKVFDTSSKKTVNELYLEILHRDADREGLTHFSALLENRKMTIDDLRKKLLDSDEYRILQSS
tara:strand:- start:98 stop:1474 length:1377 start_codon:yes stop_codon:yes gene_type:complete